MSQTVSPSTSRCYRLARVSRAWSVSRAGVYRFLKGAPSPRSPVAAVRQALVRMLTWPSYPPGNRSVRLHAKAIGKYGRDCALPGFARALAACAG